LGKFGGNVVVLMNFFNFVSVGKLL